MAEQQLQKMVESPAPIPQDVVRATPEAYAFIGGVATGKTQALVDRAVALLDAGTDPRDILVLCAGPDAAVQFRRRLVTVREYADAVRVTTACQLCLDLLATPAAQEATGRDARLLAPFELDILMEDLKTSAMSPKRIRGMMSFFYKSMTELCDRLDGWLITSEEEAMFGLLKNCLGFSRGVIEPELGGLVAGWLLDDEAARANAAVAHVLVDDYQLQSRASQVLANLLAERSIAIAANPEAVFEVFDSYPYADGAKEFRAANPQVVVTKLSKSFACGAALRAENLLRADVAFAARPLGAADGAGSDDNAARIIRAATPEAEMEAMTAYIAEKIAGGVAPEDILVASPHPTWIRNVGKALAARGIAAAPAPRKRAITGDVRSLEKCEAARVLTALYLVADEHDGVAWRSWCGFGDWQTCANALTDMRAVGGQDGKAIDAVLQDMSAQASAFDASAFPSEIRHVIEAHNAGIALIDRAQGIVGEDLLTFITREVLGAGAKVPAAVTELVAPEDGDAKMTAAAMAARAKRRQAAPATAAEGVHIVSYEGTAGYAPKVLVLCGFVNGFFPSRDYFDREVMMQEDADKLHAKNVRLLAMVVGKPTEELAASYFDMAVPEVAETLKVKIERIRLVDKKRVALTSPSVYLRRIEG